MNPLQFTKKFQKIKNNSTSENAKLEINKLFDLIQYKDPRTPENKEELLKTWGAYRALIAKYNREIKQEFSQENLTNEQADQLNNYIKEIIKTEELNYNAASKLVNAKIRALTFPRYFTRPSCQEALFPELDDLTMRDSDLYDSGSEANDATAYSYETADITIMPMNF